MYQKLKLIKTLRWHNKLPSKRCAGHVIVQNDLDEILILKPVYAKHWQLPGGVVERGESPRDGASRELWEETGIKIEPDKMEFLSVNFTHPYRYFKDFTHFYFRIKCDHDIKINLSPIEIKDYKWVKITNISDYLAKYRWRPVDDAINGTAYSETQI